MELDQWRTQDFAKTMAIKGHKTETLKNIVKKY